MANDRKDIEFRIKGVDESGRATKSAAKNVDSVTKALNEQAVAARQAVESAASYSNKIGEQLQDAQGKALDARRSFEAFFDSMKAVAEPTRAQEREFDRLAKATERADAKVEQLTQTLWRSGKAFDAQRVAAQSADMRAGYVRDVTAAVEEAEAAQKRVAALTAFRSVGSDAEVAAAKLGEFKAAATGADDGADKLSRSLLSVLDPSRAARASLEGLEEEVRRVSAVVGDADKPIRDYQDAINDLGRIQNDLLRQGAAVDAYKQQAAAVNQAQTAFERARADVLQYAQAIKAADTPNAELTSNLRQAEAALGSASRELDLQRTKLQALKAPLDTAKISVNDLATAETRLQAAASQTAVAVGKLDRAMSGQGSRTGRFLGLKPFEIQNLGFQLNDVFTQIASGTSITQTFAQQSGQILQIFPGLFSRIIAFVPYLLPIAATASAALAAIKDVADEAESVKEFSADLALSADGGRYNAQALALQAKELDRFGASMKDARAEISIFIKEGLSPDQFQAFGQAAQNVVEVTGVKLPEAAKAMAEGFTGGYDEVVKLDEGFNFLTAAELEHIRVMFESGEGAAARTEAFRIFQERAQEGADLARSDWSEAARSLTGAWSALIDKLSDTGPIRTAITSLQELAGAVRFVTGLLPGGSTAGVAGRAANDVGKKAQDELKRLRQLREDSTFSSPLDFVVKRSTRVTGNVDTIDKQIKEQETIIANLRRTQETAAQKATKEELKLLRTYEDQSQSLNGLSRAEKLLRAEQRLSRSEEDARAKAQAKGLSDEATARVALAARRNEQAKIDRETAKEAEAQAKKGESAARKQAAAANREQAAAEAAANRRQALESQLLNDVRAMDVKIAKQQKTSLDERLAAVDTQYKKIFDTIAKLEKSGGKSIAGQSIPEYKAQVEANKDLLKQQEQIGFYADTINALEKEREARLDRIVEQQAQGVLTSAEAFKEAEAVQSDLGPQIAKMADDAIAFAEAINQTRPSPQLAAFIETMRAERDQSAASTRATGRTLLADEERALNAIIAERNDLVAATNDLLEAGVISQTEAQARIEQAYARANPLIEQQLVKFRDLLRLLREQGVITSQVYDAWSAKLELISVQAQHVDANMARVRDTIINGLANGGVQALQSIGNLLGGLIDGTVEWEDALDGVWSIARTFIADFLSGLAQVIAQIAIMQAIQNMPFMNGLTKGLMDFTGLTTGAAVLSTAAASLTAATAGLTAGGATVTTGATVLTTGAAALAGAGAGMITGAAAVGVAAAALAAAAVAMQAAASTQLVANSLSLFHDGGVVGSTGGGRKRNLFLPSLAGIPRYHNGSAGVGLSSDEQLAVLQKGEEVLTEDNPRHLRNWAGRGSGGGEPTVNLKNINLFDPVEALTQAMSTTAGEKAILNAVRRNPSAFKSSSGGR